MGAVDFLQEPVAAVGQPCEDGVVRDECVELVAVNDEEATAGQTRIEPTSSRGDRKPKTV